MGINISVNAEDIMFRNGGKAYELDMVINAIIEYLGVEFLNLGYSIELVKSQDEDDD